MNVYGNSLTGDIPTELGILTLLHSLDLSENQLVGTLPTELDRLTKLAVLAIHQTNSELTGTLPSFNRFPLLRELNLESNAFTGAIPDAFLSGIQDKTQVISVSLGHNQLDGTLPESLGGFSKLIINLEDNMITGYV